MREKEIEELRQLRQRGLSYQKISEMTGHSKTTIMKYVKDVKVDKSLAIRDRSIIQLSENPLDALKDINDLVNVSVSAGVVTGAGIASIHRGFKDDSLDDTTRIGHVMKGIASLGGQIFSAYRTIQELTKQTEKKEPKTVPSPSYNKLVEKVKKLEEDNAILEKRIRNRKEGGS